MSGSKINPSGSCISDVNTLSSSHISGDGGNGFEEMDLAADVEEPTSRPWDELSLSRERGHDADPVEEGEWSMALAVG